MPRGRKSAASVEVTPMLPGSGRPEPPASLSPVEARAWRDVIDALPGFWIDSAGELIFGGSPFRRHSSSTWNSKSASSCKSAAPDDEKLAALKGYIRRLPRRRFSCPTSGHAALAHGSERCSHGAEQARAGIAPVGNSRRRRRHHSMRWWDKIRCPGVPATAGAGSCTPDGRDPIDRESCETCNGNGVIFRGPCEVAGAAIGRLFHQGEWQWMH